MAQSYGLVSELRWQIRTSEPPPCSKLLKHRFSAGGGRAAARFDSGLMLVDPALA